MIQHVLIVRFCEISGYSEKAVRKKIEEGVWLEGHEFTRAPDGHIMIDLEGYARWVEGGREPVSKREKRASASASPGKASAAPKRSHSDQPVLT